ncbi:MAG: family transporter substrate-binding protein [Rhodospirillales bacterium]|nr:family transporter substrate-binding protein [Rhodospirillales bacterium]
MIGTSQRRCKTTWCSWAFVALAVAITLAASSSSAADYKAALLLPGSINDQSWNADGYAGLTKIKELGFETAYTENVDAADHVDAMRDYARRGFNIIIGHSGRFLTAEERVGAEFPNVQFITAAGSAGFGKNVSSIDFNNRHFACLIGYLAAKMSKTGKIGGVYGLEGLPTTIDHVGSFRICAKKARPNIQVTVLYISDMEDAASAKEAAFSLIAAGADVVAGQLNAAQTGLIQAAKEKNVFVTGRSYGQTAISPENVLTNIIEKWPEMYAAAAEDVKAGKLSGAFRVYGLDTPDATGAALGYLPDVPYNKAVPASVIAELDDVKQQIASGAIKIEPTREDARGGR